MWKSNNGMEYLRRILIATRIRFLISLNEMQIHSEKIEMKKVGEDCFRILLFENVSGLRGRELIL